MHAASKGIKDFDNDIFDDFKKETVSCREESVCRWPKETEMDEIEILSGFALR